MDIFSWATLFTYWKHEALKCKMYRRNLILKCVFKIVSKSAKIRNRYNQVPHLTQDTNGKVTNSQLDTANENQEVSPFPAGDHKAYIDRRAQRHIKHKAEQKHKKSTKAIVSSCRRVRLHDDPVLKLPSKG